MLPGLVVLILMTVGSSSEDLPKCQPHYFLAATSCNTTEVPDATSTSNVKRQVECAKLCAESPDCQSLSVSQAVEGQDGLVCSLYHTRWSVGNCISSTHFNKLPQLTCYNGGVLEDGICRCVGGYIGIVCDTVMRDCKEGYESGVYRTSGVYTVWPVASPTQFQVYCEMTHKFGLTIIQRQTLGGGLDFNRTWDEYNVGFGNLRGDHWLGNTNFHYLTQKDPLPVLIVHVAIGETIKWRYYFLFNLANKANSFRFEYAWSETEAEEKYSLGECLYAGYAFSTFDNDNDDKSTSNCAQIRGGGWWFRTCYKCNLNSKITGQAYSKESDVNWTPGLNQSLAITTTKLQLN